MWIPASFEQRRAPTNSASSSDAVRTELWAEGVQISHAVECVAWDQDPIHLQECTDCLVGDCLDGARLSVRRAGSYVLFLPSFLRWLEDDWYDKGYEDPPAFLQEGAMLLNRARYADLRSLVPALPPMADLQPLTGWEAVRLLRFEAPMEVLGKGSEPVRLRRGMVLHTDGLHGDDSAVKALEKSLDMWADS